MTGFLVYLQIGDIVELKTVLHEFSLGHLYGLTVLKVYDGQLDRPPYIKPVCDTLLVINLMYNKIKEIPDDYF